MACINKVSVLHAHFIIKHVHINCINLIPPEAAKVEKNAIFGTIDSFSFKTKNTYRTANTANAG